MNGGLIGKRRGSIKRGLLHPKGGGGVNRERGLIRAVTVLLLIPIFSCCYWSGSSLVVVFH